jgi:glycosyltransferase involved in cell wall biosynthesis
MRRICIGVYFSSGLEGLRRTLAALRPNTPRTAAVLLLADGPDPTTTLELRAFSDLLQLSWDACEGLAASFNRLASASRAEALVLLQSGTLVTADWLEGMLSVLDSDARNGVVLAGSRLTDDTPSHAPEQSPLMLVRREVVRSIGSAEATREEPGKWVRDYCQKAMRAGFRVATADLETRQLAPLSTERRPGIAGTRERMGGLRQNAPLPVLRPSASTSANYAARHLGHSNRETGSLSVTGHFNVSTGYGSMSEYLVRGMSRAGVQVNVVPITVNPDGLSDEFRNLMHRSRRFSADPILFYSWPEPALQPYLSRPDLFIHTMWESSRLPDGWAEQINRAKAAIVPSKFVVKVFRDSGVTVPIEVVPDGVDEEVYHFIDRPLKEGVTTLTVGPVDNRKNVRRGIAAWKETFADDPTARLIIKTQYNYQNYVPDDPRIRYVDVVEPTRGIMHWYEQADVLLALGSEGFGLPLVEAMATGLPVIALSSEGQADVCRDARDLVLPVAAAEWEVYHSGFGPFGIHGVPAVTDVSDRLRWVAANREEARAMGRAASKWVIQHRNVWAKGPAVADAIEHHMHKTYTFRRTAVLWVPSWQSRCGISEYTAHLRESLPPSVKVVANEPDVRAMRLLHVQHHGGIFDQSQLVSSVRRAMQGDIPVVVTEHAVADQVRNWEQDASVIVSLTALGTTRLKARWPNKRIEHIPHGCPTWFPPRKVSRNKVIGAFGFLASHKGFIRVLDVLRQIPDAELLLFSSTESREAEAQWEEASNGLPVRWIREYLPSTEIARRLAAEADILAFWYDDVDQYYSASGAVRIGLATGVPVLASPTNWFSDLHGVTYQPASLEEGARRLFEDTELRNQLTEQARSYCDENSWPRVASQHQALWRSLADQD